jgi:hypothetical protein
MIRLCRPRFNQQKIADLQKREASQDWKRINREFLEKSTSYRQLGVQVQARSLGVLLKAVFSITPPHGKRDQQFIVQDDKIRTRINTLFGKVGQVLRETLTELKF